MTAFQDIWVYLAAGPLLWLTVTLIAYSFALWLTERSGNHPLVNPVLIAVICLATVLEMTGTPYEAYFEGAQFIHFMLGPATVALAVPLVRHFGEIRRRLPAILCALGAGSATAVLSAMAMAWALDMPRNLLVSLAPKSATMPIAMGISEATGGLPILTAVLVIMTGVIGAIVVTPLMNGMGIRDYAARGFAVGLASHGIGTARAFAVSPQAGLYAAIALGLNGLITVAIVPSLLRLFA